MQGNYQCCNSATELLMCVINRQSPDCLIRDDDLRVFTESFKENNTVAVLNLSKNSFSAAGLKFFSESLKTNFRLTTLYLQGNQIEDVGLTALSESLKTNCLQSLYLNSNRIGNNGAKSLGESLKVNSCLTYLNLSGKIDFKLK